MRLLRALVMLSLGVGATLTVAPSPAVADRRLDRVTTLPLSAYADHVVDAAHRRIFVSAGANGHRVTVVDLRGRILRTLTRLPGATEMALSANGRWLYVALRTDAIARIDTTTFREVGRYPVTTSHVGELAVAGRHVWFTAGAPGGAGQLVHVLDPRTGRAALLSDRELLFASLTAVPEARVVVVGARWGNDAPLTSYDARTREQLAARTLTESARRHTATDDGQLAVVTAYEGSDHGRLLRLDPTDLTTVGTSDLPEPVRSSEVATNGSLTAIAYPGERAYSAVAIVDAVTSTYVDDVILEDGRFVTAVPVPFFAEGRLYVVTVVDDEVRLNRLRNPGVPGPQLSLSTHSDAPVGHPTTLTGALTDAAGPVAGAEVVVTDTDSRGWLPPRSRVVVTAADGSFSVSYTPRDLEERILLDFAGDASRPAAREEQYVWFARQSPSEKN